jgi:glycosyltransferase involved in cell wall biosynthesis
MNGLINQGKDISFQIYITEKNRSLFEPLTSRGNITLFVIKNHRSQFKKIVFRLLLLIGSEWLYVLADRLLNGHIAKIMDDNSDLIYSPTTYLFPFNCSRPTLISLHDIQHVHFPEFFSWIRVKERSMMTRISTTRATFIQASTYFIKNDLISNIKGLDSDKIIVISEGVDLKSFQLSKKSNRAREAYSLPQKYLLYTAQLWPHKNHLTILKALKYIKQKYGQEIPLVMTGAKYSAAPIIFNYIKQQGLKMTFYLGLVPFEDIVALYHEATFYITAVLYESSSLPILESVAAGLPIIASDIPSNREMSEKLKLNLFSPLDEIELGELILRLWGNDDVMEDQIRHNTAVIQQYDWGHVAGQYLEFIKERI